MEKCGRKCEVYSRVVGYYRPVSNWNEGKKQEFKDRMPFKIKESSDAGNINKGAEGNAAQRKHPEALESILCAPAEQEEGRSNIEDKKSISVTIGNTREGK
jgi:hypothetical protein